MQNDIEYKRSARWNVGMIAVKRAANTPEKTAVVFEDEPLSYLTLNRESNRVAHYLQRIGLKKGDRIAVLALNCCEFIYVYFAAAKLGLILVPLNFRLVGPELAYQLKDSGARFLLFHDVFTGSLTAIKDDIPVEPDKFLYLKSLMEKAPERPAWAKNYVDETADLPVDEPTPDEPVHLEDPLAIIYTSGVTGDPKGAVVNHVQTYFKVMNVTMGAVRGENDVFLAQLPLFHSGGLFIGLTPALATGQTMILRQGFDPVKFAEDIEKYQATTVFALTTMWRFILDTGKLDDIDTSSVRTVLGGGERTPLSLIEALRERGLYMQQGFGQTENSAMMGLGKDDVIRKQGSIGKPGWFSDIWIQGPDGNRLPPGEIGEIVAVGPLVMSGYWNKPEMTENTIVDGVLHTGDLGYTDDEGYFYIVDRAKDMYRSGGENVYPAEVEKILYNHPDIRNVAIIGVADDTWGETGKAFIVPEEGKTVSLENIHGFLDGKAARYKWPKHAQTIDALPMTATGKIKKSELKKQYGVRLDS
ncbi:MAG: AMP-binding protein [Desulfobacterales bacterium]